MRRARVVLSPFLILFSAFAGACTARLEMPSGGGLGVDSTLPGSASGGSGMGGAGGAVIGAGGSGILGMPSGGAAADPGRIGLHRLNNNEYDNTLRDLLGVAATPARASFIPDEQALGFDSIASSLGMTEAQYEQYFNAAGLFADEVMSNAALRSRIVTCAPTPGDAACIKSIVSSFGLRAWRRPLDSVEVDRLVKVAIDAVTLGATFEGSVGEVVRVMLASPHFLYRFEPDPDPASTTPHPVDSYSLASRLSYLMWSTMPDDAVLAVAASGEISTTAGLQAELSRLLASPRASEFVSSFAGQWLGMRALGSHQVDSGVFGEWNQQLRQSMIQEGLGYFNLFLEGPSPLPLSGFFNTDVNFVDPSLANLYGIAAGSGGAPERVSISTDQRVGFLGLASFLTISSFSYRTAPTVRGKWVLESLLCEPIAQPPPSVPALDQNTTPDMASSGNVRVRLAQHRTAPACAGCHAILDPIGLGLENFDAIGRYRTSYPNGDAVDASGQLPGGKAFNGLTSLADILAADPRFVQCASKKLMTYALSRKLERSDDVYLDRILEQLAQGEDRSLRGLLTAIVMSEPFRQRRGEAPQGAGL